MSPTSSPRGFRVTTRDREIVRWIGRLRMVTAAQVTERFQIGRAVGYARLRGLVSLGLLEHARIFHASAGVYTATRAGLATADLTLPPARVDVRTYEHDLELSSLVIELEREFGTDRLKTEREMRAADTLLPGASVQAPRYAVPLAGERGQMYLTPVGHPRLHFPDCGVTGVREGGVLAVELERTPKGRARLRGILSAYVAAPHIHQVRYRATNERVQELLRGEIARIRAESLFEVQLLPSSLRRQRLAS